MGFSWGRGEGKGEVFCEGGAGGRAVVGFVAKEVGDEFQHFPAVDAPHSGFGGPNRERKRFAHVVPPLTLVWLTSTSSALAKVSSTLPPGSKSDSLKRPM